MINLVPPQGHIALKHEYILRVASVYGFLLGGVFFASAALMIPTYVLVSTQLTGARDESSRIEETKAAFDMAFGEIKIANTAMAQLRKESDGIPVSDVIVEIVKSAPRGISFTTFQAVREGAELKQIQIQGRATNRSTLASLKSALEASTLFTQAIIPISDLARDTDLSFVVTVMVGTETDHAETKP